jgi:hypothetical protein
VDADTPSGSANSRRENPAPSRVIFAVPFAAISRASWRSWRSSAVNTLATVRRRSDPANRPIGWHPFLAKAYLLPARSFRATIRGVAQTHHSPTVLSWPDPQTGPWSIRVHWQDIDGRPECVGLEVWNGSGIDGAPTEGRTPAPITATGLRDLKPDTLLRAARRQYAEGLTEIAAGFDRKLGAANRKAGRGRTKRSPFVAEDVAPTVGGSGSPHTQALRRKARSVDQPRKAAKGSKRRGRPPGVSHSPEHWQRVAEVYTEARRAGHDPTAAVAAEFDKTHSTAGKWVARCRELDLLPPTTRGKARS